MKPAPFAYQKARSLDEAVALLAQHKDARLLAGGQSLVATLNMRLSAPSMLIDINGIGGLDKIEHKGDWLEIGALVRHVQAERSETIARHAPLIARAMPHIAHPAIRNRGTLCGSVALADPAAELPACLLALGGDVIATSPRGSRSIKADDFFTGLFETALTDNEMIAGLRLPVARNDSRFGFDELARRHGDYALAGLAASATADGEGLTRLRLAFFGVAHTPLRARRAEAALEGGAIDEKRLDAAVAALDLDPQDDPQASGATRKHLAGILLRRVVKQMTGTRT